MYVDGEKDCMKSLNICHYRLCQALIDFTFSSSKGFIFPDRYTEQYYADSFSDFFFSRLPVSFFLAFNEHRLHCLAGLSEFLSISNILKIEFLHPTCCLSSPLIAGLLSYKITQCSRTCHWIKVKFDPCTNLVSHGGSHLCTNCEGLSSYTWVCSII